MKDGVFTRTEEGTVQGGPLSPLLSNVVLDELDKELESRGLEFCRFADDCNIFVRSRKAADRVMKSVGKFIVNRLKLVVNQEKSKVALSKFVKFLGFTIVAGTIAFLGCLHEASHGESEGPDTSRDTFDPGINDRTHQQMVYGVVRILWVGPIPESVG